MGGQYALKNNTCRCKYVAGGYTQDMKVGLIGRNEKSDEQGELGIHCRSDTKQKQGR